MDLSELSALIQEEKDRATFTVGGHIQIRASTQDEQRPEQIQPSSRLRTSPPVTVRWDSGDSSGQKLVLPAAEGATALKQLVRDCGKAPFGMGGKTVFDDEYRLAKRMVPSEFCTDFDPYRLGIIDTISQLLSPASTGGVRAELYNLNVYSGPSGKFRAHVDTPRQDEFGNYQFATLVVALPSDFTGGKLIVRHHRHTVEFDWSSSKNEICWAALYCDCEHEIQEVTQGHRITLTYNLFVSQGFCSLVLDPQTLPLYSNMKSLLESFKKERFGIMCSHYYAHTEKHQTHQLPDSLKGIDRAVYEICKSLGLNPTVLPVLVDDDIWQRNPENSNPQKHWPLIGKELAPLQDFDHDIEEGYFESDLPNSFKREEVKWLSETPMETSVDKYGRAMTSIGYGNEPYIDGWYTAAAIVFGRDRKRKIKRRASSGEDPRKRPTVDSTRASRSLSISS